eukprot:m51a1_g1572 hypothetical protein (833) ;mRNA; f:71487-74374
MESRNAAGHPGLRAGTRCPASLALADGSSIPSSSLPPTLFLFFTSKRCHHEDGGQFAEALARAVRDVSVPSAVVVVADVPAGELPELLGSMPAPWPAVPPSEQAVCTSLRTRCDVRYYPSVAVVSSEGAPDDGPLVLRHDIADRVACGLPIDLAPPARPTLAAVLPQKLLRHTGGPQGAVVPVDSGELLREANYVGLLMASRSSAPCKRFTELLSALRVELGTRGTKLEVVLVPRDRTSQEHVDHLRSAPWLASVDFGDNKARDALERAMGADALAPALTLFDAATGEVVCERAEWLAAKHGAEAFPYTQQNLDRLKQEQLEARKTRKFQELLARPDQLACCGSGDASRRASVSVLAGKYVALYFGAGWSVPCRTLDPVLDRFTEELCASSRPMAVVYMPMDRDAEEYAKRLAELPKQWLAIPFDDQETRHRLSEWFGVDGVPHVSIVDSEGIFLLEDARALIQQYGATAWPFTKERIDQISAERTKSLANHARKVTDRRHKHILELNPEPRPGGVFTCDGCLKVGFGWAYTCTPCKFELHPECAGPETSDPVSDKGAPLQRRIHDKRHPHLLVLERGGPSRTFTCALCGGTGTGRSYRCSRCSYDLHPDCANPETRPVKIKDPRHPHELTLLDRVYNGKFKCDVCGLVGDGAAYHCDACSYDLHVECATLPEPTESEMLRTMADWSKLVSASEGGYTILPTGAKIVHAKDENPTMGHTVGMLPSNWEELRFGHLRLRWSDQCTESTVMYYCDVPQEYTHTLELIDDAKPGSTAVVDLEVRHMREASRSMHQTRPELLQPWLDAVLGAAGVDRTLDNWRSLAQHLSIGSFSV